jgi:hypothetical protein
MVGRSGLCTGSGTCDRITFAERHSAQTKRLRLLFGVIAVVDVCIYCALTLCQRMVRFQ